MTTALHPTKTRKALLREVRAGWVHDDPERRITYVRGLQNTRTVTAAILELHVAGWVYLDNRDTWRLTEAGVAILDSAA